MTEKPDIRVVQPADLLATLHDIGSMFVSAVVDAALHEAEEACAALQQGCETSSAHRICRGEVLKAPHRSLFC